MTQIFQRPRDIGEYGVDSRFVDFIEPLVARVIFIEDDPKIRRFYQPFGSDQGFAPVVAILNATSQFSFGRKAVRTSYPVRPALSEFLAQVPSFELPTAVRPIFEMNQEVPSFSPPKASGLNCHQRTDFIRSNTASFPVMMSIPSVCNASASL